MIDHRAEAERWLAEWHDAIHHVTPSLNDMLRLAEIHALLAGPPEKATPKQAGQTHAEYLSRHSPIDEDRDLCGFVQGINRCMRTEGHDGKHHMAYDGSDERILSAEQLADLNERFRSHYPKVPPGYESADEYDRVSNDLRTAAAKVESEGGFRGQHQTGPEHAGPGDVSLRPVPPLSPSEG